MNLKRIVALALGLVMLFALSLASAQQMPSASRQMDIIKSGKSLEGTTTLKVNAEMVGALISQMQGESSAESMEMFSTLIGALNKLVIKTLVSMENATKEHASFSLGTDKAALMDIKATVDMATGENAITASVLPGIVLKMDQAQMAASLQSGLQFQQNPDMLRKLGETYSKTVEDAFAKEVLPSLKAEDGKFAMEEGEFDTHLEGDVTAVMAAKYVKAVLAVAKEDADLKQLLDAAIENGVQNAEKAAAAQSQPADIPFKNAAEAFEALDKKLDEAIAAGSEEKVLHLDAYQNKATEAMLINIGLPASGDTAFYLSLLYAPKENGSDVKATLLVKPVLPDAEPTDWAKVKEAIAAGEDFSTTVVNLALNTAQDGNKSTYALSLNASASGMPIGLSVAGDETLTGAYESNAKVALSLFSPDPLVEITTHMVESDQKAEAVSAEGAQVVEIKENASEEDMAPLMQALQEKGLPMLMENLSKALPDEAGLILQMMNGGAAQEGTTQAN